MDHLWSVITSSNVSNFDQGPGESLEDNHVTLQHRLYSSYRPGRVKKDMHWLFMHIDENYIRKYVHNLKL